MIKRKGEDEFLDEPAHPEISHCRYIEFVTTDERIYGFPLAQMVNYVLESNDDDNAKDAPPDHVTFYFSSHDVVVTGWRLRRLINLLKKENLSTVVATDARYREMNEKEPAVCKIKVKAISEK